MEHAERGTGVDEYLAELAHQRLASPHTLAAYRRDLAALARLAGDESLVTLQEPQLRRYIMQLHGRDLSPRTLARMLSAWRSYYRWLARRRAIEQNPCDGIKAPKRSRALPKVLSTDQAAALLDVVGEEELDTRDKAMFELFYSSGLRLAELAGLNASAARDLGEHEVMVTGKRGKTRTVPVGSQAIAALQAWLAQRPAMADATEPALFVSRRGTRLTARSIERRLESWAKRCGLGVHVHPHMLRHSFASHVLQSSGDLRAVQEMLGHASVAATQIYTHLDFQHLAKVYDDAHPRARKK